MVVNSSLITLQNRNLGLNPKINTFLTNCINTYQHVLTHKDKEFLKRGYRINAISGIPFSFMDYQDMLGTNYKGNFRARILKLSPLIEKVLSSIPSYYKIRGLYLDKELTNKYTALPLFERIFGDLEVLFAMTRHETLQMHKIFLKCTSSGLHERLIEQGIKPTSNGSISINGLDVDSTVTASLQIYSTGTILTKLGCTYNPIDYSSLGFLNLSAYMGKIEYHLKALAKKDFQIEQIPNWKLKRIDLNRDSLSYSFPTDDFTVHIVHNHAQIYNKKFPNGKQKIRFEDQIEPDNTISQEMNTSRFLEENQ